MSEKCLSFHLFKRVEKKTVLTKIREYCVLPLSTSPVFSFSPSHFSSNPLSLKTGLGSNTPVVPYDNVCFSKSQKITTGSVKKELFTSVPPNWTFQEFNDIPAFINDYIDNTGSFDETSKLALLIKQCHSVIVIEDVNNGRIRVSKDFTKLVPDRMVVAAIILSNENDVSSYGINSLSLNETFETPSKKLLVDALLFNENIKASKKRVLAMIIIHHLVQLCKTNGIISIDASSNEDTLQFFMDSGFSNKPPPMEY